MWTSEYAIDPWIYITQDIVSFFKKLEIIKQIQFIFIDGFWDDSNESNFFVY